MNYPEPMEIYFRMLVGSLFIAFGVHNHFVTRRRKMIENKYSGLFASMQNGFALHKIIVDEKGSPIDYEFLEVNDAFERMTGLKRGNITNRRVTEVIPELKTDSFDWIGTYGRVALNNEKMQFEQYSNSLGKWYNINAYSLLWGTQTDTEVGVNLIGSYYRKSPKLFDAVKRAVGELHGFFAFVLFSKDDPDTLIAYKRSNPLVIGLGQGENFVASDVTALLPYTRQVIYLEDEDLAVITAKEVSIYSLKTKSWVKRHPTTVHWDVSQAQKQGFPHFMLKEMYEQPEVLKNILTKRIQKNGEIFFDTLDKKFQKRLRKIERVSMISCGTAYHAGLVGSIAMEQYARIPCRTQVSSEFRYGNPILDSKDLVVLITQSGETADTLAALREAKAQRARRRWPL